ncbi:MAG TPA: hypothetical protein VGF67_22720 [Ktedonobacteraceae bacterium]
MTLSVLAAAAAARLTIVRGASVTGILVAVMIFVAAFLFLLNLALAVAFRKRPVPEVISYIAASLIEVAIFIFVLLLQTGVLTHVPLHLPPGLPVNRAEIGGTLALAVGLFPAAYWHRTTLSQLRERMANDARVIKSREGGVRVRSNAPGEWLN